MLVHYCTVFGMLVTLSPYVAGKSAVTCTDKQFACRNGKQCVHVDKFCNGRVNCRDGSDEPQYWNKHKTYRKNITVCRGLGGRVRYPSFCVLPEYLLKEKDRICSDKNYCEGETIACHDGSECISRYSFCNGQKDCRDGSDEPPLRYANQRYPDDDSFCRSSNDDYPESICVLPEYLMANKSSICQPDWRCDINNEAASEVECADGSECLDQIRFCDGLTDCRDGSDEVTSPSESWFDGRMCRRAYLSVDLKTCMLQKTHICDGAVFCQEGIDECLCGDDAQYFLDKACFKCLTNSTYVLPTSRVCDGIVDCPDLTDECLCHSDVRPEICEMLKYDNKDTNSIHFFLECISFNNESQTQINASLTCDNKTDCSKGEDELYCLRRGLSPRKHKVKDFDCKWYGTTATACDGVPECADHFEEECTCSNVPGFCVNLTRYSRCNSTVQDAIGSVGLSGNVVCDGVKSCDNFRDERGCEVSRFYCTDDPLPNIPIEKRCDLQDDCANGRDEMNCSHFYCNDGGNLKYMQSYAVCDGIQDCMAGSDECQPGCIDSAFSDERSMITSKAVLAFVWIFSILSIVGCTTVVLSTIHDLIKTTKGKRETKVSGHTKISKILILNLSISDFLVGVYTISICIKALQFDGLYCLVDRAWRSSIMCSALGSILIIGSEQSVFTMVLITIQRLHAISRPMSQPRFLRLGVVLTMSWILSLTLGLVPLSRHLEDYFVTSIEFTANKIFKTIRLNDKEHTLNWLNLINNDIGFATTDGNTEWGNLKELISRINPNITPSYHFGFYSSHTVCLPTFFPDPSRDKAWGYSLLLLTVNFVSFIFMLFAYIILYRKATKMRALETESLRKYRSKQNTRMQRKLTRIVLSDFLCWIPVCIMGYLQLAGVDIPKDAYLPVGLLIIPINSALNPLLYSDLPEIIQRRLLVATGKVTDSIRRRSSKTESTRTMEASVTSPL